MEKPHPPTITEQIRQKIGARVRELRRGRNVHQLAVAARVPNKWWHLLEDGKKELKIKCYFDIATALGVGASEIFKALDDFVPLQWQKAAEESLAPEEPCKR